MSGITRLNVYAGTAGFYLLCDDQDMGKPDNPLGLPAFPYEAALAIQDRMFKVDGSLFYPAVPGDPEYKGFISDCLYSTQTLACNDIVDSCVSF